MSTTSVRHELGWRPEIRLRACADSLREGTGFSQHAATRDRAKGYHDTVFDDEPYPVAS
jgi:UDP-glucose 4-epimerase